VGGKDIVGKRVGAWQGRGPWNFTNHFRIDFPLGLSICFWTATDGAFISKVVDKFVCGSKCDSCEKLSGTLVEKRGVPDSPSICQDVSGTDNDQLLWART